MQNKRGLAVELRADNPFHCCEGGAAWPSFAMEQQNIWKWLENREKNVTDQEKRITDQVAKI